MTVRPIVSSPRVSTSTWAGCAGDHSRVHEVGDAQRVVDRRAVGGLHGLKVVVGHDPPLDECRGGVAGRRPERTQPAAVIERHKGPVRGIQRHEHEVLQARAEHHGRRLRVDPDVELGRRRGVPDLVGAAHDHGLGDPVHDPRLEPDGGGDVRERPDGDERDRIGRRQVGLDQELHRPRRLLARSWGWDRQLEPVHAALLVQISRGTGKSSRTIGVAAPS